MTVRLYDSRAAAVVDLVPLVDGHVSMYVCGPTVQSSPHIGHLRSALVYDIWRRWLTYRGLRVTLVRNVTDIDDKVLDLAAGTDEEWFARAYRVELEFTAAYAALGILPPTYEPRATASVPQMHEIIQRLVDRGHAYAAADGSGDVYFDTGSWAEYGALTRQRREDMVEASDADPRGKRDPRDFALWKGAKPGEPATANWDSPWGPGRRAGTSSAPRCRGATSARPSTSTAVDSTCGSRTTRTSWRSRPPRGIRSRRTGCTTAS